MELSRKVLEFCAGLSSGGCLIQPTCADCVCVSPEGDCDAPGCEDIAAFALELMAERDRYRAALEGLRDCDWTISLPDRMDAVRDIARAALEPR